MFSSTWLEGKGRRITLSRCAKDKEELKWPPCMQGRHSGVQRRNLGSHRLPSQEERKDSGQKDRVDRGSLTIQVDGVEEDKARVRGQAVEKLRDLVIGLLCHPAVDELRIDIAVISQDGRAAAVQVLRGIHKGVPYGQVWERGAGGEMEA